MKHCTKCGKKLSEEAFVCPHCGVVQIVDSGSIGYFFLGFFLPIVGIAVYFACKDFKPKSANKAGLGVIISIIITILLVVGYFAWFISFLNSILSSM